jgi:hypothetical protein
MRIEKPAPAEPETFRLRKVGEPKLHLVPPPETGQPAPAEPADTIIRQLPQPAWADRGLRSVFPIEYHAAPKDIAARIVGALDAAKAKEIAIEILRLTDPEGSPDLAARIERLEADVSSTNQALAVMEGAANNGAAGSEPTPPEPAAPATAERAKRRRRERRGKSSKK